MKQEAHKKLINAKSGTADAARLAQKVRFDEFYTPQDDIKNELNHYKAKFYGKRIICPCDWDVLKDEDVYSVTIEFAEEPITPTYILNRVSVVKVKHFEYALNLINEINGPKPVIKEEIVSGDKARELLKTRVTCNFVKYLSGIANEFKIKSITASGYDAINGRGIKFQDVDYSQFDLCLTNPPFSLYKEFMECMMAEYDRRDRSLNPFDFIVLAPLTNRNSTFVGIPLFERKVFLGYNRDTHILFRNPNEQATHDKKKSVDIDWITTFEDAQKEVDKYLIKTGVEYDIYADINAKDSYAKNIRYLIEGKVLYDDYVSAAQKDGRGNIAPATIILPTLAMEAREAVDKRIDEGCNIPDIDGAVVEEFMEILGVAIEDCKDGLIERFNYIASQPESSAKFMYENHTMAGYVPEEGIISALRHGTLAVG